MPPKSRKRKSENIIYIPPIKSRTYNTRAKKNKLDEDCEYQINSWVESSNRFKLEVVDIKTNYKSREFNQGEKGHYFHYFPMLNDEYDDHMSKQRELIILYALLNRLYNSIVY